MIKEHNNEDKEEKKVQAVQEEMSKKLAKNASKVHVDEDLQSSEDENEKSDSDEDEEEGEAMEESEDDHYESDGSNESKN